VTTKQVCERVVASIKPVGGDSKFIELIKEKPDVYGLIWILVTWVIFIAFSRYLWHHWVSFILGLICF
jgi:hypothetical protein